MKPLYQLLTVIILSTVISCSGSRYYTGGNNYNNYTPQPDAITYQQFYDDLSPYGNWMNYQNYGYVWRPHVSGFRPYYSNGHWVYTSYGWTWLSDYSWGWAPFHYGRWTYDRFYGWIWVPGYEWAPAWVSWRGGGDYYGWAPLGPHMDIHISIGSIPHDYWTFVPGRYISSPRINNYYVNRSKNVTIINNTTIINNNTTVVNNNNTTIVNNNNSGSRPSYNTGPSVRDVENVTRSKIRQFNVVESDKPGATQISNNSIRVYRPAVSRESGGSVSPGSISDLRERTLENTRGNGNNRSNPNNEPAAPARMFPKDQTPQVNRNENPANNKPAVIPDRNNSDVRTFRDERLQRINNERPANVPTVREPSQQRTAPSDNPANKPSRELNNRPSPNPRTNTRMFNQPQSGSTTQRTETQRREAPVQQRQQQVESQSGKGMRDINSAQQRVIRQTQKTQETKE